MNVCVHTVGFNEFIGFFECLGSASLREQAGEEKGGKKGKTGNTIGRYISGKPGVFLPRKMPFKNYPSYF
jgi:hypothetical protein